MRDVADLIDEVEDLAGGRAAYIRDIAHLIRAVVDLIRAVGDLIREVDDLIRAVDDLIREVDDPIGHVADVARKVVDVIGRSSGSTPSGRIAELARMVTFYVTFSGRARVREHYVTAVYPNWRSIGAISR